MKVELSYNEARLLYNLLIYNTKFTISKKDKFKLMSKLYNCYKKT